ncbi:hypothetical protein ACEPAG_3918 [Sanghuangporus baumii]
MALGISEASLIGLVVESILYGLLICLTVSSWNILVSRRRNGQPLNKSLLGVSVLMFILATLHLAVNFRRVIVGMFRSSSLTGGSDAYFNSLSEPMSVFKNAVYVVQTIVGDSFILYRVYAVWDGNTRVVIPMAVLLLADLVSGVFLVSAFKTASHPSKGFYTIEIGRWALTFISVTMIINILCTGFIAGRIYWVERRLSKQSVLLIRRLSPIAIILVESGALYSCCLACQLATYVNGNYVLTILQAMMTSLIGVTYSLIIVRIGLGAGKPLSQPKLGSYSSASSGNRRERPIRPIAVEMTCTRIVRADGEGDETADESQVEMNSLCASNTNLDSKVHKEDRSLPC